jgi:hypothetical protein
MSDPATPAPNDQAEKKVEPPAAVTETPAAPPAAGSVFVQNEAQLFKLYTRFRYNELVCLRLSRQAATLEKWVLRSVVGVLALSLFTPIIPGMSQASLTWVWESLTTAATLLGVYSLIVGSGDKKLEWFRLAMRFRAWASKLESFSTQVRRGKVDQSEFDETWDSYIEELNRQIEEGGLALDEYEAKFRDPLSVELAATLRHENRIQ